MISQNRKNSIREASTTCKAKLNSGPVNRIPTVMVHRMRNPRIKRVRWLGFFMGNSLAGLWLVDAPPAGGDRVFGPAIEIAF